MATDYDSVATDRTRLERTAANSIRTLANLYGERAHFVFELLQNAEDALRKRPADWSEEKTVTFDLSSHRLRVSHFGKPFDQADVISICGVGETTKELTDIGRFGIGFKSVYAFTNRPAIHSGAEDFAIEDFVRPIATPSVERAQHETVILIPLKPADESGHAEIALGLERLGPSALLFLRHVTEIGWSVEGGKSGRLFRESTGIDSAVRRLRMIGQTKGQAEFDEEWLVFSRTVTANEGKYSGHVELAFSLTKDKGSQRERVQRVERSPLVVFFPTVVETHVGFLVHGPYRTTPSRDNVPSQDQDNQRFVLETASLLVQALCWLRDHDLLDTSALRCLPLDGTKFGEGSMLAPLFLATKRALADERLLPRFGGGHVAAANAKLARTQELRDLFDASQLTALFNPDGDLAWLSSDISQNRTPELYQYLMRELGIAEVTPEAVLPKLDAAFLEVQADDWVRKLYEFLNGQPALRSRAATLPLIRLSDGKHVPARGSQGNGQLQAFLPGAVETSFPTVRAAVCATEPARAFLRALGLTEPDAVDDVVRNVLPKYHQSEVDIEDDAYSVDVGRILAAFATNLKDQREKLLTALRETPFVMTVDAGSAIEYVSKPGEIYLATERLKELFAGVPDVLLLDDRYPCLRGEDMRELLEACGAVRYLRPVGDTSLSGPERDELRSQAGHAETSGYGDRLSDWMLVGLPGLLDALTARAVEERRTKAKLLWEELAHLEERRGKGLFTGEYTWTHYGTYRRPFDAAFVRLLMKREWVPDVDGNLQRPELVLFDALGWNPNPFLLSKIHFKPQAIIQLAKEAGIEPGVLDLVKKLGLTEAQLRARLGLTDDGMPSGPPADGRSPRATGKRKVEEEIEQQLGEGAEEMTPGKEEDSQGEASNGPAERRHAESDGQDGGVVGGDQSGEEDGGTQGQERSRKRTPGREGGRPFHSYVAVRGDGTATDAENSQDGAQREALERAAIQAIVAEEPSLQPAGKKNQEGYDLSSKDSDGHDDRWVEVKALSGPWGGRSVGMSKAQLDFARRHGSDAWLYVVEFADNPARRRIIRIQDPWSLARTFTFDEGWDTQDQSQR